MPEIKQISAIPSLPGCRRDGTQLDGDYYNATQWVRFQRGRPKKMGGFQLLTHLVPGPVGRLLAWTKQQIINLFSFNPEGASLTVLNNDGVGGVTYDRTPAYFNFRDSYPRDSLSAIVGAAAFGNTYIALLPGTVTSYVSNDVGVTWEQRDVLPSTLSWSLVFQPGDGKFYAVATGSNVLATSTDYGVSWSSAASLPASIDWGVFSNGFLLSVGGDTNYSYFNGISFTAGTFPSSRRWRTATDGAGTFVAIENTGTEWLTSADAATWTQHSTGDIPYGDSVTYADWPTSTGFTKKFFAADASTNSIWSSVDGLTWAQTKPFGEFTIANNIDFDTIVYIYDWGLLLFSSGTGGGGSTRYYGYSLDGVRWGLSYFSTEFDVASLSVNVDQPMLVSNFDGVKFMTRSAWDPNNNILWSADSMYDSAAGSQASVVLAVPTHSRQYIDNQDESPVYWTVADSDDILQEVTDSNGVASGGVFVTPPYAVLYGTDGKVTWSNANEPQNYTTGDAGTARVTSRKIVYGTVLRTGGGPGGLLWSLDSVIKMQYVGGQVIFNFQTLSSNSTILSQNGVVEYDGNYYWPGVDRFLMTNGATVQEIPNQLNLNWFFDNLNFDHRQRVWGTKVPRYGEIWWFYPRGDATECTHAVILNVREGTWYDTELARSAGVWPLTWDHPLWITTDPSYVRIVLLVETGYNDELGDGSPCSGLTSGFRGVVVEPVDSYSPGTSVPILVKITNGVLPIEGETVLVQGIGLNNMSEQGTVYSFQLLDSLYLHEKGYDKVEDGFSYAIKASFDTSDLGLPSGGFQPGVAQGLNRWTRVVRVEPDFIQVGPMTLEIIGNEFPNSEDVVSNSYYFEPGTEKIDMREQSRLFRLRFTSDVSGGHFEMGRVMVHTEPGDVRN